MKQTDTWSCYAVVACMATGTSLDDFVKHCGHDGSEYDEKSKHPGMLRGFSHEEVGRYLIDHGVLPWMEIGLNSPKKGLSDPFGVEIDLSNIPCFFIVVSERLKECTHVLYWDTVKLWDPSPDTEDGRPFDSYHIKSIHPIPGAQKDIANAAQEEDIDSTVDRPG